MITVVVTFKISDELDADILKEIDLSPTAKVGSLFDVNTHEIIDVVNDLTKGDEIIIEVIEQGFIYKDNLINYAKVKVNKLNKEI